MARADPWGGTLLVLVLLTLGAVLGPAARTDNVAAFAPSYATVGAMRHLDGPAYEPTIGITPAGNLFYSAATTFDDPAFPTLARVLASYDQGATWTVVTNAIANEATVFDPYLTVDPETGRVFRVMAEYVSPNGACMQLITSDDEGATWAEHPDVCASPPFHDHESIATGKPRGALTPSGYPNLVHLCVNHVQGTMCSVSLDGGASFLPPVPAFAGVNERGYCGGLNSPVRTDSEGRVFVTRIWCDEPAIAVSEDGGITWMTHLLGGPTLPRAPFGGPLAALPIPYIDTHVLALAIDADDDLHVLYTAGDGMPYYLTSRDHGASWSHARQVAAPGISASDRDRIAIAAAAPGHVALAYLATDHPDGYATRDWDGAEWDMWLGVLAGDAAIEWTKISADPLGVDDCGTDRCIAPCAGSPCPGMYDYVDVQIAPDGRPWIAMVDTCLDECAITGEADRAVAAVGTLASGPSLTRPGEALPPLPWT